MVRLQLAPYSIILAFLLDDGLNSTMVRLQHRILLSLLKLRWKSQFHYGSITTG